MKSDIIDFLDFNWSEKTAFPQQSNNKTEASPIVNFTGTAFPFVLTGIACCINNFSH